MRAPPIPRSLPIALLGLLALLLLGPSVRAEDSCPRWIVVAAPAFAEAVGPLADHRAAQGYDVVRVTVGEEGTPLGDPASLQKRLHALCQDAPGPCYVLLVGAAFADDPATVVPTLQGGIGRMKGEPSDNAYGCLDEDLMPDVPLGRFPVRTVAEARTMVAKTLRFEGQVEPRPWRHRLTLLVGHPGGATPLQKRLAVMVVETAVGTKFAKVHPQWQTRAIIHAPESPFYVPDGVLADRSLAYLKSGQLFSIYLGHSNATGLWSAPVPFLRRHEWKEAAFGPTVGVHLSCGCHTCQLSGYDGEGYGLEAMRNPLGPVAVVGAHGESYGAMGKLAFEGLLPLLAAETPPRLLGDWWLAMKGGIAEGHIGKLMFFLFDRADGSNSKIPLAVQREEHLEMWMLLGDPALRLPLWPLDLELKVEGEVRAGNTLVVKGVLPAPLATAPSVVVELERPFGTVPADAAAIPAEPGPDRDAALLARHDRTNDVGIARVLAEVEDGHFAAQITLPDPLPWDRVVLRASALADDQQGRCAVVLRAKAAPSAE